MADGAARIAAAYFAHWKAKDFAALRTLLADDVEYAGPLARHASADACRDALAAMAHVTADLVVHQTFVAGNDVTTWFDLHTTITAPTSVANWMRVENGKITSIRAVYDPRGFVNN